MRICSFFHIILSFNLDFMKYKTINDKNTKARTHRQNSACMFGLNLYFKIPYICQSVCISDKIYMGEEVDLNEKNYKRADFEL